MPDRQRFLSAFCIALYVAAVTVGAFTGGVWGLLGIGGGLILYFGTALLDRKAPLLPKKLGLFVLLTLGVLALEVPFSSNVPRSAATWLHLASIFVPLLLLLSPRVQERAFSSFFLPVVAMAIAIGAIGLGFEHFTNGAFLFGWKNPSTSLSEYNRGIAHIVILAFAIVSGLWAFERKSLALGLVLILLFPAVQTLSQTVKFGLLTGAICTGIAFFYPRLVQNILKIGILSLLAWPFYAAFLFSSQYPRVALLPDSWRHRIEIWDFLSYRIAERPLFGWGLGTTNGLDFTQPHGDLYRHALTAAPHAHNFIMQTWVETGLVGLSLCIGFLFLLIRAAGALQAPLRPFALGCIALSVVVCLFGFDFWTDALWAAFALTAFVFGVLQKHGERKDNLVYA